MAGLDNVASSVNSMQSDVPMMKPDMKSEKPIQVVVVPSKDMVTKMETSGTYGAEDMHRMGDASKFPDSATVVMKLPDSKMQEGAHEGKDTPPVAVGVATPEQASEFMKTGHLQGDHEMMMMSNKDLMDGAKTDGSQTDKNDSNT